MPPRYFNEIRPVGGTAVRETRGQYDVCRLTMKGSSASISEMLAAAVRRRKWNDISK